MRIDKRVYEQVESIEAKCPWHAEDAGKMLQIWHKTGLSLNSFAGIYSVKRKRLFNWARKLNMSRLSPGFRKSSQTALQLPHYSETGSEDPAPGEMKFIEVKVSGNNAVSSDIMEISTKKGYTVRISPGYDSYALIRLMTDLSVTSC